MAKKPNAESSGGITGRDGYIVCKALAYAIAYIQSLPKERQEYSDCCDMVELLRHYMPDALSLTLLAKGVDAHTGTTPDLVGDIEGAARA